MIKFFKEFTKCIILFIIGGIMYCEIEIIWRGYTHWTMAIVGGICFVIVGGLNNYIPWEMEIWKQAGIGAIIITSIEFISGIILNIIFKMNIWDYSNLPVNILGQICLPFSIAWLFLSFGCIVIDDYLRYILFKEEKPRYYF